jgi:phosphonate transport system substrate-binding protein
VEIWRSSPIPGAPVVIRRDLPEDMKARIKAAFADMHDVPWGKGSVLKRWAPATDADYQVVRDTAKLLKLDLEKMK